MKKLFKLGTTLLSITILLSSCGSSFTVMKRHYNSGYYVDYTESHKEITPKAEGRIPQPASVSSISVADAPVKQTGTSLNSAQSVKEESRAISPNQRKESFKTNLVAISKLSHITKLGIIDAPNSENKQPLFQSPTISNAISDDGGGERAALSLLWLVIVIVLILWLIGILAGGFGLGGLINLLLLVALILLILWLLRVI